MAKMWEVVLGRGVSGRVQWEDAQTLKSAERSEEQKATDEAEKRRSITLSQQRHDLQVNGML